MQFSITPGQIRQNNRLLIYHLIYNKKKISQLEICAELHLSRPTVGGLLAQLEESGLIRKEGTIASEMAGRKAAAYTITENYRIAVGVEIRKEEFKILAVNLYGDLLDSVIISLEYHNADFYYKELSDAVRDFLSALKVSHTQVLGIGIAMEAILSPDGSQVIYGRLLENTRLSVTAFSKYLRYPCTLMRTVNCAAAAELWASPDLENALYLSLSEHLGAAAISGRSILTGKHGHSTSVEHLQMRPGGKRCYCGRNGCMETLCSLSSLLRQGENAEDFFRKVRDKDSAALSRWNDYLTDLSSCINTLHLIYDTDYILGGTLARYLTSDDVQVLYQKLALLSPYTETSDYLSISSIPLHDPIVGAALPYIWSFLGNSDL